MDIQKILNEVFAEYECECTFVGHPHYDKVIIKKDGQAWEVGIALHPTMGQHEVRELFTELLLKVMRELNRQHTLRTTKPINREQ